MSHSQRLSEADASQMIYGVPYYLTGVVGDP